MVRNYSHWRWIGLLETLFGAKQTGQELGRSLEQALLINGHEYEVDELLDIVEANAKLHPAGQALDAIFDE